MSNRALWLRFAILRAEARDPSSWEDHPMTSQIRWLRTAYWTGAIADTAAFVLLMQSALFAATPHEPGFQVTWEYRYSQAFAAALMAGWTVLLVWADRKPLERRGVLPITVVPVIVGLNAARWFLYRGGIVAAPLTPTGLILPAALTTLFLFAYFNSFGRRERSA